MSIPHGYRSLKMIHCTLHQGVRYLVEKGYPRGSSCPHTYQYFPAHLSILPPSSEITELESKGRQKEMQPSQGGHACVYHNMKWLGHSEHETTCTSRCHTRLHGENKNREKQVCTQVHPPSFRAPQPKTKQSKAKQGLLRNIHILIHLRCYF